MKVTLNERTCVVERGDSPKIYSESGLLHKVKVALIDQGHDVIKKRMWKDGHVVDELQQYIRDRKWKFAIRDGMWNIRKCTEPFNQDGAVVLNVERWEE